MPHFTGPKTLLIVECILSSEMLKCGKTMCMLELFETWHITSFGIFEF